VSRVLWCPKGLQCLESCGVPRDSSVSSLVVSQGTGVSGVTWLQCFKWHFLEFYMINRALTTRLFQWFSWVFAIRERKKSKKEILNSSATDSVGYSPPKKERKKERNPEFAGDEWGLFTSLCRFARCVARVSFHREEMHTDRYVFLALISRYVFLASISRCVFLASISLCAFPRDKTRP